MYTIYQNSNDCGHGFGSFKKEMINICNQQRDSKKAFAFAFILYDFENPQLWKILNDNEYWQALNKISGKYLTVFSINYKPKRKKRKQAITPMLFAIPIDYSPAEGSNKLTRKYFGDISVNYPAILFFQVNKNSVVDSILIELKEEEIEKSYLEIKEYIKKSVDALKLITPENRLNYREIFNNLESNVKQVQSIRKIKRNMKNYGSILKLFPLIKSLF